MDGWSWKTERGHLKMRVKKLLDMYGVSGLRKRSKGKKMAFLIFAASTAAQQKPLSNKTLPFST